MARRLKVLKHVPSALLLGAGLTLALASTVSAGHTHVRTLGNGQCVIIAEKGGEEGVNLPDAVFAHNPKVVPGTYAENRQHPLHVLVHLPGSGSGDLYVKGSPGALANCIGYVND